MKRVICSIGEFIGSFRTSVISDYMGDILEWINCGKPCIPVKGLSISLPSSK